MRGDDAVGPQTHQLLDEGERTPLLVGRVGTLQNFVEDDEELLAALQTVDDGLQPLQFGEEVRLVVAERVGGAQARHQPGRVERHLLGTDGRADAGQQVVHADGAQVGALARHVSSRNDDEGGAARHADVVAHAAVARDERMAHRLGHQLERRFRVVRPRVCVAQNVGVGVPLRMVVGERAQRAERVHLADGLQPVRQFARMDFLPRLDAHNLPQLPEEAAVQHGVHQVIVALVQFVHQLHQPPDGLRGLSAVTPNLVFDGPQERGFHRLIVHRLKQLGVGAQDAELLSVDTLHLGNLPREGEAGHYDAEPQHAPYVGWQHARYDTRQAEEVDRRHHVGQPSQQAAVAVADGALRPLQQLGTVGRLPLVQQA